jgi:hypothetical protein
MKNITATFGTLGLLATMLVAPMAANASSNDRHAPRQNTSNVRLNVSIGSAVLGFLGLGGRNDAADCGVQYSGYHYDQDRVANYAQRRDDQRNREAQSNRNDRGSQNSNRDRR